MSISFDVQVSIKGSGHHFAGIALQEGAIIIDVSRLKTIAVDKDKLTARLGAGVTGLELYTYAAPPLICINPKCVARYKVLVICLASFWPGLGKPVKLI